MKESCLTRKSFNSFKIKNKNLFQNFKVMSSDPIELIKTIHYCGYEKRTHNDCTCGKKGKTKSLWIGK
jgi:hypothetical protein